MPDFELNAARVSIAWFGIVIVLLITKRTPTIPKQFISWTVAAVIVQNITSLLVFISVTYISLASFQCTATTICLASGVLVHKIMNNDHLSISKIIAIFVCSIGICFALQPQFLYPLLGLSQHRTPKIFVNNNTQNDSTYYNTVVYNTSNIIISENHGSRFIMSTRISDELFGYILAATHGVMLSFQLALMRKLTSSEDFKPHWIPYLFWNFTFGIIMSAVLMLVRP